MADGGSGGSSSSREASRGGFELLHDGSVSLPIGVRSFDPVRSRTRGGCCGCFPDPFGRASSTSAHHEAHSPPPSTIIPCEDVVGAVRTGAELSVWHMPLNSKGRRLLRATTPIPFDSPSAAAEAREALIKANCGTLEGGRLEVMLNPASGPGKARAIWGALLPLLRDAAGIECASVTESAAPGHLTAVSRELSTPGVRALVVVGGDGTLHEVLQGLLGRPDWRESARLPLLQVPAGSGNALSASLRILDPFHAAYVAIKGSRRPLDAATVLHPSLPRRTYSFLSVATGLLANLDHGTEDLRWMGGSRFTVGALREIMAKRTTRVRLRYLPAPAAADARFAADHNKQAEPQHGPPCPLLSSLGIPLPEGASPPAEALEQLMGKELLDPSSRGWEELPDPLVQLLVACNLPWLSETHHVAPPALLDDGAMTLVWTAGCTRAQGLQVLLKTETEAGDHMSLGVVRHAKAAAMLLEPLQEDSLLVVDGELLPRGPVYVEVHPGLLTVLADDRSSQSLTRT